MKINELIIDKISENRTIKYVSIKDLKSTNQKYITNKEKLIFL